MPRRTRADTQPYKLAKVVSLFPMYRWGHWGPGRLSCTLGSHIWDWSHSWSLQSMLFFFSISGAESWVNRNISFRQGIHGRSASYLVITKKLIRANSSQGPMVHQAWWQDPLPEDPQLTQWQFLSLGSTWAPGSQLLDKEHPLSCPDVIRGIYLKENKVKGL